jgi:hypothetical protein
MSDFAQRMIGAAKLRTAVYEEVEGDSRATGQALAVVALSSVAAGLGVSGRTAADFAVGAVAALLGWLIWATMTWFIGAKMLPEPQTKSNIGELLRTTGFSSTPGLFHVFGRVPLLGAALSFGVSLWMLVAMIIAVRQALDYRSTFRAAGVCLIGWLFYALLWFLPR